MSRTRPAERPKTRRKALHTDLARGLPVVLDPALPVVPDLRVVVPPVRIRLVRPSRRARRRRVRPGLHARRVRLQVVPGLRVLPGLRVRVVLAVRAAADIARVSLP